MNNNNSEKNLELAKNPNISVDILEQLANDKDEYIRKYAVLNSNISETAEEESINNLTLTDKQLIDKLGLSIKPITLENWRTGKTKPRNDYQKIYEQILIDWEFKNDKWYYNPVDRAEASNQHTSPKRLEEIYHKYSRDEIRSILTSNPNTPWELLVILGEKFPAQLLENPAWDLYLLANPNLLVEIPKNTLISLLKLPQAPKEYILFSLKNRRDTPILEAIISTHTQIWQEWRINNLDLSVNLSGANF